MWDKKNISFIKFTIFINIILLTLVVSTASAGIIPPDGGSFQLSDGLIHPYSSGFAATPISKFLFFNQPLSEFSPPVPANLRSDQGNFWVNYTWEAGSGILTDSYYVNYISNHNDLWNNGSSLTYLNTSAGPHGWSNITVWAYNNSGGLSLENISMATQVKNNKPVLAPIGNQEVVEGDLIQFIVTASDADFDTLTFGTDASNGSFDPFTGAYSWQTAIGDAGEYTWNFHTSDNYDGNDDETITVTVKKAPPILTSIDIEPASKSLLVGENVTFTAYPKDQYDEAFAASVTWSNSDITVGTIDDSGNFTAIAAGRTTITAESGLVSGTAEVNVTAPMPVPDSTEPVINFVSLNNSTPNTDEDIRVIVNATDDIGIISVVANDVSLANQGGDIWIGTITALAGTHFVNVSASDAASNIGWNNSTSYSATTLPSPDITKPVINFVGLNNSTPNTNDAILVTVNATDDVGIISVAANGASLTYQGENIWNGTITAFAGTHFVNVSASDAASNIGWNNFTSYTATTPPIPDTLNSINVTPSQVTLLVGNNQTFIASPKDQKGNPINVTITWSSSNETVGTINTSGTFTALSAGTTIITAANGSVNGTALAKVTASVLAPVLETITISPPAVNLSVGGIQVFTAVPKDQNGNPINATIIWSNSNPAAGTINTSGANTTYTAIAAGTSIITAANGSVNGTATINVTALPITPPITPPIIPPTTTPITPILTTITVFPQAATMAVGGTQVFTATTKDQNGNPINATITWSSSNLTVGTVDASGKFTAKVPGSAIVNATNGLIKGTAIVTVAKPKLPPSSNPNGTYTGKEGIPVSFDGSKSFDPDGSIVTYFWNFGDGTNGTGVNPTHTYIHSGNYPVSLKVIDNDGLNATNSTSAIIEKPVITIKSPANGQNFETSSIEVKGTALSNVSRVQVKVGNGPWENASGKKSWNSTITLSEGANTISARANYSTSKSEDISITVTYDPPHSSDTGGTGNIFTGTSGGGGGNSGENAYNIELTEKYDLEISRNKTTSYWFRHLKNPIMYVNITGNTNMGLITTSTELLKNTSTLVNNPPGGLVYKNVNIWVGTSGLATPRNIKEALVKFRVDNNWMSINGVKGSDIVLVKWDGKAWVQLETIELSRDDAYTYFQGKTNAFSPFAITTNSAGAKSDITFTDQEVPIESGGITPGNGGIPIQPGQTAIVTQTVSSGTSWSIILTVFVIGIIAIVFYFLRVKK